MGSSLLGNLSGVFFESTTSTPEMLEPSSEKQIVETIDDKISIRKTTKPNPDSATIQSSQVNLVAVVRNSVDAEIAGLKSDLIKLEAEKADLLKKIHVHEELKKVIVAYDSRRVEALR